MKHYIHEKPAKHAGHTSLKSSCNVNDMGTGSDPAQSHQRCAHSATFQTHHLALSFVVLGDWNNQPDAFRATVVLDLSLSTASSPAAPPKRTGQFPRYSPLASSWRRLFANTATSSTFNSCHARQTLTSDPGPHTRPRPQPLSFTAMRSTTLRETGRTRCNTFSKPIQKLLKDAEPRFTRAPSSWSHPKPELSLPTYWEQVKANNFTTANGRRTHQRLQRVIKDAPGATSSTPVTIGTFIIRHHTLQYQQQEAQYRATNGWNDPTGTCPRKTE